MKFWVLGTYVYIYVAGKQHIINVSKLKYTFTSYISSYRYVRALGALYMRLTGTSMDCYKYLEPLYLDYRKIRRQNRQGGRLAGAHFDYYTGIHLRPWRFLQLKQFSTLWTVSKSKHWQIKSLIYLYFMKVWAMLTHSIALVTIVCKWRRLDWYVCWYIVQMNGLIHISMFSFRIWSCTHGRVYRWPSERREELWCHTTQNTGNNHTTLQGIPGSVWLGHLLLNIRRSRVL